MYSSSVALKIIGLIHLHSLFPYKTVYVDNIGNHSTLPVGNNLGERTIPDKKINVFSKYECVITILSAMYQQMIWSNYLLNDAKKGASATYFQSR